MPEKSGTFTTGSTTGNVAVVHLPNRLGELVIVAYIKKDNRNIAERELAMANIDRAAYDYFLFNTPAR